MEQDTLEAAHASLMKAIITQAVKDATYNDTGSRAKPQEREEARQFLFSLAAKRGPRTLDRAKMLLGDYCYGDGEPVGLGQLVSE